MKVTVRKKNKSEYKNQEINKSEPNNPEIEKSESENPEINNVAPIHSLLEQIQNETKADHVNDKNDTSYCIIACSIPKFEMDKHYSIISEILYGLTMCNPANIISIEDSFAANGTRTISFNVTERFNVKSFVSYMRMRGICDVSVRFE